MKKVRNKATGEVGVLVGWTEKTSPVHRDNTTPSYVGRGRSALDRAGDMWTVRYLDGREEIAPADTFGVVPVAGPHTILLYFERATSRLILIPKSDETRSLLEDDWRLVASLERKIEVTPVTEDPKPGQPEPVGARTPRSIAAELETILREAHPELEISVISAGVPLSVRTMR